MRGRLSDDQAELLAVCAGREGPLSFRTSLEAGTLVEIEGMPGGGARTSIVDVWDLADEGLIEVAYEPGQHAGTITVTAAGHQVAASL